MDHNSLIAFIANFPHSRIERAIFMSSTPGTHHPNLVDFILLITLALIWGSSFMLIKLALADFPPATLAAGRILLAAIFLFVVMKIKNLRLPDDIYSWKILFLTAITGMTLPFVMISWAQQTIDSNIAAILISLTPLTTLIIAHYTTDDEKITVPRAVGLSLGFMGVILLFGGMSLNELLKDGLAQMAMIASAFLYTISNLYLRKVAHLKAITSATGVVICASFVSTPFAMMVDQPWTLSPGLTSILAIAFLGIVSSAIAVVIMAALVFRAGVGFMTLNNYLVPIVGVIWGVSLLNEALSANAIIGFGLILLGVAAATLWRRKKQ